MITTKAACLVAGLLAGIAATPALAQKTLYAQQGDSLYPVVKVSRAKAYIVVDGKTRAVVGKNFLLRDAEEYLPALVMVDDIEASSKTSSTISLGGAFNNELRFKARFTSPYMLDDVYLVLEINASKSGEVVFFYEIGQLKPYQPYQINIKVPVNGEVGKGSYDLHLFSGSMELLNSEQPIEYREGVLDRLVAKRIAGSPDVSPRLLIGPPPVYPPALLEGKTTGDAVISMEILSTGAVRDPAVVRATNPAFGEAALTAVRLWRFLPKISSGVAVATKVSIPFDFAPPPVPAK